MSTASNVLIHVGKLRRNMHGPLPKEAITPALLRELTERMYDVHEGNDWLRQLVPGCSWKLNRFQMLVNWLREHNHRIEADPTFASKQVTLNEKFAKELECCRPRSCSPVQSPVVTPVNSVNDAKAPMTVAPALSSTQNEIVMTSKPVPIAPAVSGISTSGISTSGISTSGISTPGISTSVLAGLYTDGNKIILANPSGGIFGTAQSGGNIQGSIIGIPDGHGRLILQTAGGLVQTAKIPTQMTSHSVVSNFTIDHQNVASLPQDQNVAPLQQDQNMTPLQQDQNMTPLQQDQNMTPLQQDQNMTPLQQDQKNVPLQQDQNMTPLQQDQKNVPLRHDQKNVPLRHDQKNVPLRHDQKSLKAPGPPFSYPQTARRSGPRMSVPASTIRTMKCFVVMEKFPVDLEPSRGYNATWADKMAETADRKRAEKIREALKKNVDKTIPGSPPPVLTPEIINESLAKVKMPTLIPGPMTDMTDRPENSQPAMVAVTSLQKQIYSLQEICKDNMSVAQISTSRSPDMIGQPRLGNKRIMPSPVLMAVSKHKPLKPTSSAIASSGNSNQVALNTRLTAEAFVRREMLNKILEFKNMLENPLVPVERFRRVFFQSMPLFALVSKVNEGDGGLPTNCSTETSPSNEASMLRMATSSGDVNDDDVMVIPDPDNASKERYKQRLDNSSSWSSERIIPNLQRNGTHLTVPVIDTRCMPNIYASTTSTAIVTASATSSVGRFDNTLRVAEMMPEHQPVSLPTVTKSAIGETKGHRCEICSGVYGSLSGLSQHKKIHLRCDVCDELFTTFDLCKAHRAERHNKSVLDCGKCDMSFSSYVALRSHQKNWHPKTNQSCGCKICGKTYHSPNYVMNCQRSHLENKPLFSCSLCDAVYLHEDNLYRHMHRIHSITNAGRVLNRSNKSGKNIGSESGRGSELATSDEDSNDSKRAPSVGAECSFKVVNVVSQADEGTLPVDAAATIPKSEIISPDPSANATLVSLLMDNDSASTPSASASEPPSGIAEGDEQDSSGSSSPRGGNETLDDKISKLIDREFEDTRATSSVSF